MTLVLLARNPTASVTHGLLPAAHRAGLGGLVLTDDLQAHRDEYARSVVTCGHPAPEVQGCAVDDVRAVLAAVPPGARALATNSDHLQVPAALAADYLGLPGKDWRSALRARDKGLMRATLRDAGLDDTPFARLRPGDTLPDIG